MSNIVKKTFRVMKEEGVRGIGKRIKYRLNPPMLAPYNYISDIKFNINTIDIVLDHGIDIEKVKNALKESNYKFNYFGFDEVSSADYQKINDYTYNNVFSIRAFIFVSNKHQCKFKNAFTLKLNEELLTNIDNLIKTKEGLKLLANYNNCNNISVKTSTFFNSFGTNYFSGGAERYMLDLYEVCSEMNLNLNIYQNAEIPFFRKYNNINVIGLKPFQDVSNISYQYVDIQTKNYIYHTFNNTQLNIYSAFQECFPNYIGPAIGISHGISWDHCLNKAENAPRFWDEKQNFIFSALYCDRLISVDTNTANWFQTIDYKLGNEKFKVIPNYVDTNVFKPRANYLEKKDKIIITYPRRLYEPRGLYIALNVVDKILSKYPNVEFHFVGKGNDKDIKKINAKIKKYPNKVFCYSKSPFEMPSVYQNSDISLIPTLYSEGTSLSCLEAMASGNLVISTRIGGLTDLIINGLNGYLIEPNAEALYNALDNALSNYDKQDKLRKTAIETAKVFNKDIWKERWKSEIEKFHLKNKSSNIDLIEFYVNDADNLSDKIMQKIKEELENNNLIYIKSKKNIKTDKISHDLIQLVPFDEEVVSDPIRVYSEKGLKINYKYKKIIKID